MDVLCEALRYVKLIAPSLHIPTQIGTHSVGKSTLVPIEIGTCSDANRHTLFRVS